MNINRISNTSFKGLWEARQTNLNDDTHKVKNRQGKIVEITPDYITIYRPFKDETRAEIDQNVKTVKRDGMLYTVLEGSRLPITKKQYLDYKLHKITLKQYERIHPIVQDLTWLQDE